jgi:predicted dehydrogenase
MKLNEEKRVAFIGAGYMGKEHVRAFQDIPNVLLSGVFSRTREQSEQMAKQFSIAEVCESISELYASTQADLVVIAVPELALQDICREAFKYPWMCLIEKPAGYNLADAEAINALALTEGAQAFVALNRRHYGSTRTLLRHLASSSGQRIIHLCDQEDQVAALSAGQPKLVVKNWMYANSIHIIDYLTILGRGKIKSVEQVVPWNPELPRFVLAKILYDSGDIGIYEAHCNIPGPWSVSVSLEKQRLEMRPLERIQIQEYGSRSSALLPADKWDDEFKPELRLQAQEAIKALDRQTHLLPKISESLISMQLVQEIYGV